MPILGLAQDGSVVGATPAGPVDVDGAGGGADAGTWSDIHFKSTYLRRLHST